MANKFNSNLFYIFFLGVLFLVVSFFVQENFNDIAGLIEAYPPYIGMSLFVFVAFMATVVAPIASEPLIPLASNLWGWQAAGALNLLGWTLGAYVAFKIASKYGRPVVKRFVSLDKIEKYQDKMPKEHVFWTVVILRIIVPFDILSYALGIFTKISTRVYMSASFLGMIPSSFILAYIGSISFRVQIVVFLVFFALVWTLVYFRYLHERMK